jgi:RNA polymerase sigma-70 factor, ECF subfamily
VELSDAQLIKNYFKGDEAAFEALLSRYLPLVYGIARQYVGDSHRASDIAQETFIKAWRNLKKFDRERSFGAWIGVIAKHTALDWLRRREEIPFSQFVSDTDENFIENIPDGALSMSKALEQKEGAEIAGTFIAELPEDYRTVVSLRHENDLTFREIARRLKAPLNTVKSRYRRALIVLKKQIGR